jgi:polyisoprenoid-binding protein YceI
MRPAAILVSFLASALATAASFAPPAQAAEGGPLTVTSARVVLEGTSNIHAYTASTKDVRVTGIEIGGTPSGDVLAYVLEPGALKALEVAIPAASLKSDKADLDKNMHKALKVKDFAEIRFRLRALEAAGSGYRALGALTIAGVEKDVALTVQVERKGAVLAVTGATELLMTDYGITPPKAMLGMLKTNPKVQIEIELLLAA